MVHWCICRFYLDVLKANEQKLTNLKSHLKHFLCSRFNFQYFYLVIWTILPRIISLLMYTKTINQYNIYRIWYILSFLQFTVRACGVAGTVSYTFKIPLPGFRTNTLHGSHYLLMILVGQTDIFRHYFINNINNKQLQYYKF